MMALTAVLTTQFSVKTGPRRASQYPVPASALSPAFLFLRPLQFYVSVPPLLFFPPLAFFHMYLVSGWIRPSYFWLLTFISGPPFGNGTGQPHRLGRDRWDARGGPNGTRTWLVSLYLSPPPPRSRSRMGDARKYPVPVSRLPSRQLKEYLSIPPAYGEACGSMRLRNNGTLVITVG